MPDEAGPQLRAWVEYYRDLGVHEFYRRGEPGVALVDEGDATQAPIAAETPIHLDASLTHLSERASVLVPTPLKLVSFNELAPRPGAPLPAEERAAALRAIQEEIGDCTRCPLAYA